MNISTTKGFQAQFEYHRHGQQWMATRIALCIVIAAFSDCLINEKK
jgi:hypothetical protein